MTGSNLKTGVSAVTSATTVLSTSFPENIVTLVSGAGIYSPTIAAGNTEQPICLTFVQPASGSAVTVTFPTNVKGWTPVGMTLNTVYT